MLTMRKFQRSAGSSDAAARPTGRRCRRKSHHPLQCVSSGSPSRWRGIEMGVNDVFRRCKLSVAITPFDVADKLDARAALPCRPPEPVSQASLTAGRTPDKSRAPYPVRTVQYLTCTSDQLFAENARPIVDGRVAREVLNGILRPWIRKKLLRAPEASSWKGGQKMAAIHDPALTERRLLFFFATFDKESRRNRDKDLECPPVL